MNWLTLFSFELFSYYNDFVFKIGFESYMLFEPVSKVLRYPLLSINDQEVTFGKILVGVIFLTAGIYASRFLIRLVSQKILSRVVENEAAAHAIENISFYLMVVFFSLVALQVANIPITVFSYAAGAAAIAIGLGSQKIVYNFISGLIILIEQPVKKGDFVKVGDIFGRVEDVGTRATKINSFNNKHLILPNSRMIEEDIENLTHNSKRIKSQVKVGVRYGSDIALVKRLLMEAAKENIATLKSREPIVLFEDFGSSSLDFSLIVDIKLNNLLDERKVTSTIREAIDKKFRENDVVIAFPQQDVHLHMAESVRKKLVG
jgi:small-conductance mechanosensitive channel